MTTPSAVSVSGHRILAAEIHMPCQGAWWADLNVDTTEALPTAVTIDLEGTTLVGAVHRGDPYASGLAVRVVGGKNGLGTILEAKHYRRPSASLVARDICADAGEELLSSTALDATLESWTRIGDSTAGAALTRLAEAIGVPWRITLDGKVTFGEHTWTDAKVATTEVLNRNTAEGSAELSRFVQAGTSVLGAKVTRSTVRVGASGATYCVQLGDQVSASGGTLDRLKGAFKALVRGFGASRVDYFAHYACEVIAQSGASVDVRPDDARIPGLSGVEVDLGLPGTSVDVPKGARCMVGWRNGDPRKPYVSSWLTSTSMTALHLDDGNLGVARVGDVVTVTLLPGTAFAGVSANPLVAAFPFTLVAPVTLTGTIMSGSTKVKA